MTGALLSSLFAVVIALAVVLGLAWVLLKALRTWQDRFQGKEDGGERPIRFLRAMPLGQTERVVMVAVRGETMLLGVTAGGISLLARWPEDDPGAIAQEDLR
ncbi:flagellar biosynthetic protein FliO [Sphingomonas sp. H39-1-10]|uniref:FliO/MopB family protein n=1 Tax=Sphingomonas TaxID=13687 RepID=UPI00088B2961|nr:MULTISPECIES: flagellar biosynthetic protein FliO [Sphingomonas]MDF0490001.1 flagellar biosynthetic protein FliO [Sphingomonas pollutisoli]SDA36235.1 flagellar biosynthetic protein FliO [Sphingomonas sp. NFR15]